MDNPLDHLGHSERTILVVDADEAFVHVLQTVLGRGYSLERLASVDAAIERLDVGDLDSVLLNLDLPASKQGTSKQGGADARDLLKSAAERPAAPPIIVYSWDLRPSRSREAFELDAADFLAQPLDIRELKFALDAAHRRTTLARDLVAAKKLAQPTQVEGLLGHSKAMERVNDVIRKVAEVATTVLITGESGTGKGVVAQAIHRLSARAERPFVAFSPCALPESLIEDELFGHDRGAFTGATQVRRGRFEEANGGTIFLDEIGDLALPLQTKLLRVLQERSIERLGSDVSHPIDVRVVCATSRNLAKMVQEGTFREDLYFRISVVNIPMPPLRQRLEDLPLLAEHFLRVFAKEHNKRARALTSGFLAALAGHNWPGNVRELQNVIERSLVLANGDVQLGVQDLPQELRGTNMSDEIYTGSFHEGVRAYKRELVRAALRMHGGNKLQAARELRISRCYLHRLLNQLNIHEAGGKEALVLDEQNESEEKLLGGGDRLRLKAEPRRVGARVA